MNRDDQTYLLNSEILVIVGHILDRREKQLMKNGACEETEELTAKSEDGGSLSSDEELSYYSGNESPPLSESDLCNSDVDTDELLSLSEYEEMTPAPAQEKKLKKRGSFLSYVLNKARKWRSKKKTNGKEKVYHEPESDGEDIKLSIVCEYAADTTDTGQVDTTLTLSQSQSATSQRTNNSHDTQVTAILDPRSLDSDNNINSNSTSFNEKLSDCRLEVKKKEASFQHELTCPLMNGYGLSEGDIRSGSRRNSYSSVNSLLSEEYYSDEANLTLTKEHLLNKHEQSQEGLSGHKDRSQKEHLFADYVKNLTKLSQIHKLRLKTSDGIFAKLVQSCDRLSPGKTADSFPEATAYSSLVDLRENGKQQQQDIKLVNKLKDESQLNRHSYHGDDSISQQKNQAEQRYEDEEDYGIDSLSLLAVNHIATASGEITSQSCDSILYS